MGGWVGGWGIRVWGGGRGGSDGLGQFFFCRCEASPRFKQSWMSATTSFTTHTHNHTHTHTHKGPIVHNHAHLQHYTNGFTWAVMRITVPCTDWWALLLHSSTHTNNASDLDPSCTSTYNVPTNFIGVQTIIAH